MFKRLCGPIAAAFITALAPAAPALAATAAARVLFASGDVSRVRPDGGTTTLARGDEVFTGDLIQTRRGIAQLRFGDGGFVSVQHHSRFRIAEYFYGGSEDGREHAIFDLLKGGIRALSGAIGHQRRERYQMRTTVATIGIRGTAYSALFCQRDCAIDAGVNLPDGLHAKTTDGSIVLQNDAGELTVPAGAAAFVADPFSIPVPSTFEPSFARAEPASAAQKQAADEAAEESPPAADAETATVTDDNGSAATDAKSSAPGGDVIDGKSLEQDFDQRWTGGVGTDSKVKTLEPILPAPTDVLIGGEDKSGRLGGGIKQETRDLPGIDPASNTGSGKDIKLDLPTVPVLIDDRLNRGDIKLQPQLNRDLFNYNDIDKSGSGKLLK